MFIFFIFILYSYSSYLYGHHFTVYFTHIFIFAHRSHAKLIFSSSYFTLAVPMREVSCERYTLCAWDPIVHTKWFLVFRSSATSSQRLKTALSLVYNNTNWCYKTPHRLVLQLHGCRCQLRQLYREGVCTCPQPADESVLHFVGAPLIALQRVDLVMGNRTTENYCQEQIEPVQTGRKCCR